MYCGKSSGYRVPGYGCKFEGNDNVFNSGKRAKDKESGLEMHRAQKKTARFDEVVRKVDCHHSIYPPSTSSVLISPTIAVS